MEERFIHRKSTLLKRLENNEMSIDQQIVCLSRLARLKAIKTLEHVKSGDIDNAARHYIDMQVVEEVVYDLRQGVCSMSNEHLNMLELQCKWDEMKK